MTKYQFVNVGRNKSNRIVEVKDDDHLYREVCREFFSKSIDMESNDGGKTWVITFGIVRPGGRVERIDKNQEVAAKSTPLQVQKSPRGNGYAIINPDGDAELGNWVIAECFFESNAKRLSDRNNMHDDLVVAVNNAAQVFSNLARVAKQNADDPNDWQWHLDFTLKALEKTKVVQS